MKAMSTVALLALMFALTSAAHAAVVEMSSVANPKVVSGEFTNVHLSTGNTGLAIVLNFNTSNQCQLNYSKADALIGLRVYETLLQDLNSTKTTILCQSATERDFAGMRAFTIDMSAAGNYNFVINTTL